MQHVLLCLMGFLLFPHSSLIAQLPEPTPTVTIHLRSVPLQEVLSELEKQTGMFFSYESSLLKEFPNVTLIVREETLSYCLKRLFSDLPIVYRMTGRYIILKRKPRQFTISGFVRDSVSYESLISASVLDRLSGRGVVTNNYGFYSLTLPPGFVTLSTSYVGYEPIEITFDLKCDTLIDLPLRARSKLKEIVVEGSDSHSNLSNTQLGMLLLTPKEIKQVPSLMGEPDLIKTLQMTPGVAMGTEAMASLHVRGGNADENLVLIDGNPLYQIGHLGGLFSAFNPDAVKLAGFYKGSFPARFGERLSSVVDVHTKDGDMYEYHGSASIGLIAGNLNLSGPIVRGKTSFNVAVRRTWLDALLAPALAIVNKVGEGAFDTRFRYAFQDVNAKINHFFSDRSRLEMGLYYGDDILKLHEWPVGEQSTAKDRKIKWRWGNLATSANWNYLFNNKMFGTTSLSYSRYRSNISHTNEIQEGDYQEQINKSRIEDFAIRYNLDYIPHSSHHIKSGFEYTFHLYTPQYRKQNYHYNDETATPVEFLFQNFRSHGHELAIYAEDEWRVNGRLMLNLGLRFSNYNTLSTHYASVRPRTSLRYRLFPDWTIKASYSEMNQYVHMLSETSATIPSDFWLPITDRIRPMVSRIVSAGIYTDRLDGYVCSVEGYYKTMSHLLEYRDDHYFQSIYTPIDEQITEGSGRSRGVEFMIRKKEGKLTGWAGYTLSWSDRLFPELNHGRRFPARFDNRHKLNIVATYAFNKKLELTAAWTYASGNHLSFPVEVYYVGKDPLGGTSGIENIYGYFFHQNSVGLYAPERNNVQLPAYHRLDIGLNVYIPKKRGRMGIWNFSLYNAYCRLNPISLKVQSNGWNRRYLQTFALLPIVPSVSYTYKF